MGRLMRRKRASGQEDRHPEDEALRARTEVTEITKRGRQRPYRRDADAVEVPRLIPTG